MPKEMSSRGTKEFNGGSLGAALSRSKVFKDYEKAFTQASGLPLTLREPLVRKDAPPWPNHNSFCALMAGDNQACAACYELQRRLESEAQTKPTTLKCFAGLCESAVPVRVGGDVVAFLETGHVLRHKPSHKLFSKFARQILDWGCHVDLKKAEDAWLASAVLPEGRYEAFVGMLAVFARHLGECGNGIVVHDGGDQESAMRQARDFIATHSMDDLSVQKVARVVNLSAHYFCKKFKEATGMGFTEYVARVRVEKAMRLLREAHLRVSEVAFQSGFQSVSQFNRMFHRLTGQSPREFRAAGSQN